MLQKMKHYAEIWKIAIFKNSWKVQEKFKKFHRNSGTY